jgi:hypothetical protein
MNEKEFNPQSMDAKVWAIEFMRLYRENALDPTWVDEGLMIGWFANAIMAGYDESQRRAIQQRERLVDSVKVLADCLLPTKDSYRKDDERVTCYIKVGDLRKAKQLLAEIKEKK